jgi:hypothetical protein
MRKKQGVNFAACSLLFGIKGERPTPPAVSVLQKALLAIPPAGEETILREPSFYADSV